VADEVVRAAPRVRTPEGALGGDQALAHAVPELGRGRPTERHEQQLGQLRDALGHVTRGERGDRERLAGAGAGLEHRGALRQLAAHVEHAWRRGKRSARVVRGHAEVTDS
jgi:hypothetical protein